MGCNDRISTDARGSSVPWRGKPEILERPEPVDRTVSTIALAAGTGPAVDLTGSGDGGLTLHNDGALHRLGPAGWTRVTTCTVPGEPSSEPWAGRVLRRRLHSFGELAAVVNDHGVHGEVIELSTGAVTLRLHAPDDDANTVAFALAFTEHDGRPVVIHRTRGELVSIDGSVLRVWRTPVSSGTDRAARPSPRSRRR